MTQSLDDESGEHIKQIAEEVLEQLEKIAEMANSKLHDGRTLGSDTLASINTMTSSQAIQRLDQISQANRESYQVLVAEPGWRIAFARLSALSVSYHLLPFL